MRMTIAVLSLFMGFLLVNMNQPVYARGDRAPAAKEGLLTLTFPVEGMTCSGCEFGVKKAVKKLEGVESCTASYKKKNATVTFDSKKVTAEQIVEAINKTGYKAQLPQLKKK